MRMMEQVVFIMCMVLMMRETAFLMQVFKHGLTLELILLNSFQ